MNAFAPSKGDAGPPALRPASGHGRRSSPFSWRWIDRLALAWAWTAGLLLCLIAGAIVVYMGIRGIQYLRPALLAERPAVGASQSETGGFLDPLEGTGILTLIGILLATPLGVCSALWITEYGRPSWLARIVETSIEVVAGTPDIVIALPPLFTATRDGLQAVPKHMREAAYAIGKTRIATIRRVLLPSVRSNIATGVTLGVSRTIGDTAIVVLLLGLTLRSEPQGSVPGIGLLRGTGSTLTTYVFQNSPAGEGAAPQKAYAAAFVLLVFVLALNLVVGRIGRRQADELGLGAAGAIV